MALRTGNQQVSSLQDKQPAGYFAIILPLGGDKGFFGVFGGSSSGLEKTNNFMNAGGDIGDVLNKTPNGPTQDQLYRIYELYKSGKLNRKDVQPIEE